MASSGRTAPAALSSNRTSCETVTLSSVQRSQRSDQATDPCVCPYRSKILTNFYEDTAKSSIAVNTDLCGPDLEICFHGNQVISGQQLPKVNQKEGSIVDPLVRVEIYGVPQDQAREETSHINNNGEKMSRKSSLKNFIVNINSNRESVLAITVWTEVLFRALAIQ